MPPVKWYVAGGVEHICIAQNKKYLHDLLRQTAAQLKTRIHANTEKYKIV